MNTEHNGISHYHVQEAPKDQLASPGLLIDTFQHHRLMILATSVLALAGMYVYVSHVTPLYTSTARVYVEPETQRVIKDREPGAMMPKENYLYTQIAVIKSASVLAGALASLDGEPMQTFSDPNSRMSVLYEGLTAQVGKMDGIINVSFKGPHPAEAADVANAVVDAYVDFHAEAKRRKSADLLNILRKRRIELDEKVAQAQQRLLEFRQQNEGLVFGTDPSDNIVTRGLATLSARLIEAELETIEAKSLYEAAQRMAQDPPSLRHFLETWPKRGGRSPVRDEVAPLQAELKRIERDKADILLELKANHPAIAALDAAMERIRKQISELDKRQLTLLEQEYLTTRDRKEELARRCEAERRKAIELSGPQADYTIADLAYKQAQARRNELDDRITEIAVTEEVGGLPITILESARAAGAPSEPRRARLMAIALLLGMCGGVGLGLVREVSDKRIRSSQEVEALLRLPVLGVIPTIKLPLQNGIVRAQTVRVCPNSQHAEAFRRLRVPFLVGSLNEKAKVILVTSPVSGEGKTLLASNLALSMAHAGKKVLIVDGDCIEPGQHKIFKKDRQAKGLSMVLTGQTTLEEAIEPTGTKNLDILTCGPYVSNSAELLTAERLGEAIRTLAARYDRVLIDSSPVLPVADAQILAAQCDGVVLVVRAEMSIRRDIEQAYGELTTVGARLLGVVVNAAPRNGDCYRYNRYHRYNRPIEAIPREANGTRNKKHSPFELLFDKTD